MAVKRAFASEDRNLNTGSVTTARTRIYSDIDLSFAKRPGGDIYKKTDAAAVKQAVKNLLMTNRHEKPFKPYFGGNLYGLLFELASDPVVRADLRDSIVDQINIYEPRARVTNVETELNPDNHSINITVYFVVKSTNEQVTLETTIKRLR